MNLDEAVAATCIIIKGDTPIKVWWTLRDDFDNYERNLSTNDGVVITRNNQKVSVLTIEAVKARHRGNYTCYAQNKAGIAQFSAFLAVNGLNFLINIFSFEFCNLLTVKSLATNSAFLIRRG